MQILSRHITQSGGLSFVWEDHNGYHVSGMTVQEVRRFLYEDGLICNRVENMVYAKRRTAIRGTTYYWVDYSTFLEAKLKQHSFCEKILSTNTLLK